MHLLHFQRSLRIIILLLAGVLGATFNSACKPPALEPAQIHHGYALLYGLLSNESDIDKLLLVKKTTPAVETLLKEIAATAQHGREQMKQWQQEDPQLNYEQTGLPEVETRTRNHIARYRAEQLLLESGEKWQLTVLLTQSEAAVYITYLATVLAKDEADPERKQMLEATAQSFSDLSHRITELLSSTGDPSEIDPAPAPKVSPVEKAIHEPRKR